MLKFNFLGKVRIENEEEDLTGKLSSKSVALLALLLMKEGKTCGRRQLMSYLWPDSTESAAKYNLRYNLWQLKKILNSEKSEETFLIVTKEECRINENFPYQCDLQQIGETDIEAVDDVARLEKLAGLFRGDFFEDWYFAGCAELDEMIILQRYNLENRKLRLFRKLARLYFDSGRSEKCLKALDVCDELDPYDERHARIRLELLMEEKKYIEADRYYHRFCRRLVRDIGAEPSQELKNLIGGERDGEEGDSGFFSVEAAGIAGVEFYYLSEVLGGLMQIPGFRLKDYLSESQIADLSSVQPLLGRPDFPSHPSRIAAGFISLICGSAEAERGWSSG